MKLGFCGAGCCGGKYTVDLYVYLTMCRARSSALNRIGADMSIPVMSNFSGDFASPPAQHCGSQDWLDVHVLIVA
jgi:hypothetical protein